jgi:hypothetical protein
MLSPPVEGHRGTHKSYNNVVYTALVFHQPGHLRLVIPLKF